MDKLGARVRRVNRLFLFTVVLPTIIAIVYFGLLASDVFTSESKFLVRSPMRQSSSLLAGVFDGSGLTRSQDDSYTVQGFILSRDALKSLNQKLNVENIFGNTRVDRFSRFSGLDFDNSFEGLYRYYQKKVNVQIDSSSSIITLSVKAYSAGDAYHLDQQLLEMSENLINQLNTRARQDTIRFALAEVNDAEKKATEAALALSAYRNRMGVIDPERQSTIQLQQIAKLQDDLVTTKTLLNQLKAFSKDNPQIPVLENRVRTIADEITSQSNSVAGGNSSLAGKAAEYQRLSLERDFADKQLTATLASLEQSRNEAQRKQLYLERISEPSLPDMAMEPKRLLGILGTFIIGLIVWGVLTILIAGLKEHRD
jgi:capsular polysaccharide transport system permease protein